MLSTSAVPVEVLDRPAAAMAQALRERHLSAEQLVSAALARASALNERTNCFTLLDEPGARAAARAADRILARGGRRRRGALPLLGVPFAAKDLTPTAGHLTTSGSWSSADFVPSETALCIRRLQAAGAVLIGKTTTPEFAYSSFTQSPRWGTTRNPWDLARTPGGSSGGSAAAVAGGCVPFAEGSDMGGSIRIPASFCGVVGLKPSLGRIPMTILPSVFDNISHLGPIARTVDDAILFMQAAAGPSDEDPLSLPLGFDAAACRAVRLEGRRFALSVDLGYYAVAPEVEAAIRAAAARLAEAGASVEEVALPWSRALNDRWTDLWAVFMSAFFGDRLDAYRDRMDPAVVALIEQGRAMDATSYKRLEILRTAMWRDMAALLARFDALLCPTCAQPAPLATACDDNFLADLPDGRFGGLDMTCPFNLVPALPALSLPAGHTTEGLPVGLQIVGRRHADEAVLGIALALERLLVVPILPYLAVHRGR